ncbi:acyltransferase [Botryosphaeria dothidea]|uniref:Acyltransferase n=1 Tax=Botryosphaeria dothidea TaxID=55169 RepID=A0A8H4MX90_9PEZI|nr:acyltransferase [Botryosphaeria dothidea]
MPPKKRAKPSTAATPHASTPSKTPTKDLPPAAAHTSAPAIDILNDPWTDDQETSLFKNLIRWKPTGVHKHMHMIQIASSMSREGFSYQMVPVVGGGGALHNHHHHTRIPGIWKKLGELYDLEALDERENAHALAGWPDVADRGAYQQPTPPRKGRGGADEDVEMADPDADGGDADDEDGDEGPWFRLPDDDFGQLMWDRRIAAPPVSASAPSDAAAAGTTAPTVEENEGAERSGRGRRKPSPRVVVERNNTASKRSESPPACPELLPKIGDPAPLTPLEQQQQNQQDTDQLDTDDARSHAGSPAASGRSKGAGGGANKGGMRGAAAARSRKGRGANKAQSAEPEDEEEDEEEESSSEEEEEEGETPPATREGGNRAARSGGRRTAAKSGGGGSGKRTSGRKK